MNLIHFVNAIICRVKFAVKFIHIVKLMFDIKFMLNIILLALYYSTKSLIYIIKP